MKFETKNIKKRLFHKRGTGVPSVFQGSGILIIFSFASFRAFRSSKSFSSSPTLCPPVLCPLQLLFSLHHNLPCVAARLAMRRAWKALRMSLSTEAFLRNEGRPRASM